jgi:hypothetical protein
MQLREAVEESEKMMNVMLICRKFHGNSSNQRIKTETEALCREQKKRIALKH